MVDTEIEQTKERKRKKKKRSDVSNKTKNALINEPETLKLALVHLYMIDLALT